MTEWYCLIGGEQHGPLSEDELIAWARQGRLRPEHLVWAQEMNDWAEARSVGGLFAQPGAAPEPQTAPVGPPPPQVALGARHKGLCIAGMVLGIVSVVLWCIPLVNAGTAATGLVLSIVGVRRAKGRGSGRGIGIAGIVLSAIGLVLSVPQIWMVIFRRGGAFTFGW